VWLVLNSPGQLHMWRRVGNEYGDEFVLSEDVAIFSTANQVVRDSSMGIVNAALEIGLPDVGVLIT
jgi:hypothetical protein